MAKSPKTSTAAVKVPAAAKTQIQSQFGTDVARRSEHLGNRIRAWNNSPSAQPLVRWYRQNREAVSTSPVPVNFIILVADWEKFGAALSVAAPDLPKDRDTLVSLLLLAPLPEELAQEQRDSVAGGMPVRYAEAPRTYVALDALQALAASAGDKTAEFQRRLDRADEEYLLDLEEIEDTLNKAVEDAQRVAAENKAKAEKQRNALIDEINREREQLAAATAGIQAALAMLKPQDMLEVKPGDPLPDR